MTKRLRDIVQDRIHFHCLFKNGEVLCEPDPTKSRSEWDGCIVIEKKARETAARHQQSERRMQSTTKESWHSFTKNTLCTSCVCLYVQLDASNIWNWIDLVLIYVKLAAAKGDRETGEKEALLVPNETYNVGVTLKLSPGQKEDWNTTQSVVLAIDCIAVCNVVSKDPLIVDGPWDVWILWCSGRHRENSDLKLVRGGT